LLDIEGSEEWFVTSGPVGGDVIRMNAVAPTSSSSPILVGVAVDDEDVEEAVAVAGHEPVVGGVEKSQRASEEMPSGRPRAVLGDAGLPCTSERRKKTVPSEITTGRRSMRGAVSAAMPGPAVRLVATPAAQMKDAKDRVDRITVGRGSRARLAAARTREMPGYRSRRRPRGS
jgi:hypothetical protein